MATRKVEERIEARHPAKAKGRRRRVPAGKDRRALSSPRNIAAFIPEPLSERGAVTVAFRLPVELAERMDAARGDMKRSGWLRELVEERLGEDKPGRARRSQP